MLRPQKEVLTDLELLDSKLLYYIAMLCRHFTIIEEFTRVDVAFVCKFTLDSLEPTTKHYDGNAESHSDF